MTRISTGLMYQQSVATLLSKQAKLAHTQQQLASGQKLITAKDNPVAAGNALGLDRSLARLERFAANAGNVQNRLGLQENALRQVGDLMARANELTLQANNAPLGNDSRAAISTELKSIYDGLLALANSTDGTGRYLFAGSADSDTPFMQTSAGVLYSGDQTQRQIEIAPDTFVSDNLPGSEIFLRLRTGTGRLDASPAAGNTGTGLIMDMSVVDAAAWDGGQYRIAFTAPGRYDIYGSGPNPIASGNYSRGQSITVAGVQVKIDGQPNGGDQFTLGPSSTRDIFATLQNLIGTLTANPTTDAQRTAMQNRLQSAIRDIAGAQTQMIDARASGGAQLMVIDNAAQLREANTVTLKDSLSGLRDLDWAEAIGRYALENAALQAAQNAFTQMQQLSLFKLMR